VPQYIFEGWEDGSTNPTRIINLNANKEIEAKYKLANEMVEINKTITKELTVTVDVKWIHASTAPTTPDGYIRADTLDISLGALGTLFAFIKE
jgi:hypothetical protein